jgi:deazaflavin-dependent oxidoreductase (nitroreductase family)
MELELSTLSSESLRRLFKKFNRFMLLLWRLGLGGWGNGTRFGGQVMVIKHTGRKTGLTRHTPLNYALIEQDMYCTAGFGVSADWYRNLMSDPHTELWLPDGRWSGQAEDVTSATDAAAILRQVIIASGFAGPLFGVNPKHLSEQDLAELLNEYRLIRIRRTAAVTGPGGPGDLAWIWPLTTFLMFGLFLSCRFCCQAMRRRGR